MENSQPYVIERLGLAKIKSPLRLGNETGDSLADYTRDDARTVVDLDPETLGRAFHAGAEPPSFELAGPRELIYFDPPKLKVGIVTCGGICPGVNDVIRGLVMTLRHGYRVGGIIGFKYGFAGLNPTYEHPIVELDPKVVRNIHLTGGTLLGTSRGHQDPEVMVDSLERQNIGLLFAIGGGGTFRGAQAIHKEIQKRNLKIGVIAIPKTIDNDIPMVDHTFGFDTAVSIGAQAIQAAYSEASSLWNGIGLVKLMGRHAGFIAANAALAVRNVNVVLIPEVPFDLEGQNGLFSYLERRIIKKKFTVIVVAEGAGQQFLGGDRGEDASGNAQLGDIGVFLKDQIAARFKDKHRFSLKYIDPSYIIRSQAACSSDSIFCGYLAQAAAHAGMSGRTGMAVGRSYRKFTHIPLCALIKGNKQVDPEGELWLSVLESTGQPFYMTDRPAKRLSRLSFLPEV